MNKSTIYAWLVSIVCFLVLMIVTPSIPQSQDYHDFADHRQFFGIPNTLNVVSNFPFLIIGLIGLVLCYHENYFRLSLRGELYGWTCFYIGVALVAFGSSYYHLKPNDARLVWDRLPMTIAFTSIISIFIIERIDEYKGTLSIIPLLLVGIVSILYWCLFDDLRPYALVQFVPCIAIPLMTILLPPMYTHSTYWLWAAGFYLLAKVEEASDKLIYKWTYHIVSGHTLKHLCASMVPVFLTLMLAKRTIEPDRQLFLVLYSFNLSNLSLCCNYDLFESACLHSEIFKRESTKSPFFSFLILKNLQFRNNTPYSFHFFPNLLIYFFLFFLYKILSISLTLHSNFEEERTKKTNPLLVFWVCFFFSSHKMAPSLKNGGSNVVSFDGLNDMSSPFAIDGSDFTVDGHLFLSDVPENIVASPSPYTSIDKSPVSVGCFVGFDASEPDSRHVVSIGKLKDIRFMSIFRFKVWWTTHWVGRNGGDLESETQIVILEKSDSGRPYVLLLPIVEGPFRTSIQPGDDDFVDVCVESGSSKVVDASFRSVLYLHAGDDPFALVKEAMKIVRTHLGTFRLLEEKTPPGIVDKFGWCTWDAFYLTVHPQGVIEGVKHLVDGGCPPGLVLIDDGWQSIGHDSDPITKEGMNQTVAGEQMPCRLLKFQENYKFRDYVNPKATGSGAGQKGMKAFIDELKGEFKTVEYVYVWHALCGYWGGLRPQVPGLPEARVIQPVLSPGLQMTMEDLAVDKIVLHKVGLVPPEKAEEMYEGLHSHLEKVGIDGVKIDVIHLLEMLCEDYGGRVDLAKAYYKAMTKSINKHFKGNGVIASMEHCNDFMFLGTEAISLGRVGDDFWCTDPSGDPNGTFWLQGCHMVHCAYNSLWMGNFIHPDWDMFQSTHPCAAFHAASRAISGGPIYVSDSVGKHNFDLLKKLVLPDGSILRSEYYALPTRDCLFADPLHNGETMLKIWNLNKFTGVIGAFNCQGGGWCRETRRNQCFSQYSKRVTSKTNPKDIEWHSGENPISIEGVKTFVLYLYQAKKLIISKPSQDLDIALDPFEFELITVSPVTTLTQTSLHFAPIGLVNMLNTGGAIQSVDYDDDLSSVEIGVKGCGEMRVFASKKPRACRIDGEDVGFKYDQDQMVVVQVPWPVDSSSGGISVIEYLF